MKRLALLLPLVAVVGCHGGSFHFSSKSGTPGSGKITTESPKVGAFSSVEHNGVGSVTYKVGPTPSITIKTDDNLQKKIKTTVKGDKLVIDMDDINPTKIDIEITAPKLEGFELNGAGSVVMKGLTGDSLNIESNGAGSFELDGTVRKVDLKISGAGSIEAFDLKADDVNAQVSGAGSIELDVEHELTASVDGVGSIQYKGKGKAISKSVSGMGSIEEKN